MTAEGAPRRRSTAARRATRAAKTVKPMEAVRAHNAALDKHIAEQGGDKPIEGRPRPTLAFSSVTPPAKKTAAKRPTKAAPAKVVITKPYEPFGGPWRLDEARRLVKEQGYSLDRVKFITGFTEPQLRVAGRL